MWEEWVLTCWKELISRVRIWEERVLRWMEEFVAMDLEWGGGKKRRSIEVEDEERGFEGVAGLNEFKVGGMRGKVEEMRE